MCEQRLLIPSCSFIWLFPGGYYKRLAFSHQRVTICLPSDIGLRALLFLAHNIFDAVQPSSSFLRVYSLAVLDLEWNTQCMVMSFLVPMSASFRSSRLQLTTAAGYRMAGTAKALITVTLFLLKSLLLRARLTRFLYSEVATITHYYYCCRHHHYYTEVNKFFSLENLNKYSTYNKQRLPTAGTT